MADTFCREQCGRCGVVYWVPQAFMDDKRRYGKERGWYCPNGHQWHYTESEADQQRRRAERAEQQLARAEQERAEAERQRDLAVKRERRLKKRTAAGTCPCCKRTFANMATHMKKQHPDFIAEQGGKVVPLKSA